jgi:hypothetical protein
MMYWLPAVLRDLELKELLVASKGVGTKARLGKLSSVPAGRAFASGKPRWPRKHLESLPFLCNKSDHRNLCSRTTAVVRFIHVVRYGNETTDGLPSDSPGLMSRRTGVRSTATGYNCAAWNHVSRTRGLAADRLDAGR